MKTLVARLLFGRRAHAALAAARDDLQSIGPERAIAARSAVVPGRRRPLALRGVARAMAAELSREEEEKPCLPRAVALYGEARALGFEPSLVLGVRHETDRPVESHAWLELDGQPFLEDPKTPSRYETIARLPT